MTSLEYRDLLAALGLTQAGAARLLGVDERTSRRWANEERDIPAPVQRFLRFLAAAQISPHRAMTLLEKDPPGRNERV